LGIAILLYEMLFEMSEHVLKEIYYALALMFLVLSNVFSLGAECLGRGEFS